jgi:hypothetical protein
MYSTADYFEMIIIFGERERNAREAARVFKERFPGRNDNYFFCSTLSEFENFLLCERILINVTTCQKEASS